MANQVGYVHVEIEKDEQNFTFIMPIGAKLGSAYDAAYDVLLEITDMAKKATEQAKSKEASNEQ